MYKIFYHKGFHDAFVSLSLFFDFSVRVNSKINKKKFKFTLVADKEKPYFLTLHNVRGVNLRKKKFISAR